MPTVPIPLAQRSNVTRTGQEGCARLINFVVEENGADAKHPFSLYAASGLEEWATMAAGDEIRAMLAVGAYLYVVSGRVLYRVDGSGTAVTMGGIPTDGAVTMASNRREPYADIGIVSDGLYFVIRDNVLRQVADVDLPPACSIAAIDGQFILPGYDDRWFITGVDDALSIDALDFASAESSPDNNVRVAVVGQEAVLLGSNSAEWWRSTDADFPFARTAVRSIGCYAAGSVSRALMMREGQGVGDVLIWAGTDHSGAYAGVMMASGYDPVKISHPALDRAIAAEPDQDSIHAFSWVEGGHSYYAIVGDTFAWQYDTAGFWVERSSYGLARWRIQAVAAFAGMLIAGDYTSGALYRMSSDIEDEGGTVMVCTVQTPVIHAFPRGLVFHRIDVDATTGVGLNADFGNDDALTADDGSTELEQDGTAFQLTPDIRLDPDSYTNNISDVEPVLMLDWSDDGGKTWFGESDLKLGRNAQTSVRPFTTRAGSCDAGGRSWRIRCSANVTKAVHALSATVTERR